VSFNYGGNGTSPFLLLGVALFVIAIAYFLLVRNPNFLRNLERKVPAAHQINIPNS